MSIETKTSKWKLKCKKYDNVILHDLQYHHHTLEHSAFKHVHTCFFYYGGKIYSAMFEDLSIYLP